ncbi:deoxynucleotide monophosphate kinase [Microbacterium phage Pumpernickel]|uniref:Deoxynucleoside monophosphate kinase n=1 Tax=Microbacterium phage Pumpernickel TaxID=2885983 RepID=A0AAE8YBM1_9CAUD|nr:deoxynucleotide monophosphate kinase [Microbacterium phage Pumpernickel]UDL15974.1 deoxynucleoside monophosphate kinase [Microbacterium phage Pumpernickel]
MTGPRIVGIGGKLASGKDAIADHLVEKHGWVKFGMSDALAEALYVLNPSVPAHGWTQHLGWFRNWLFNTFFGKSQIGAGFWVPYQYLVDEFGYVEAKRNPEVRRLLQVLGTEVGRKMIDEDVWTNIAARKVREARQAGAPGVILTGIRYPNELDMIYHELSGETWWVNRPDLKGSAKSAEHSSENSVSSVDFERVIQNTGTLEELYQKVDKLIGG